MSTALLTDSQAHELDDAPEAYRRTLHRVYAGKAEPSTAIRAMCLQCTGYRKETVQTCGFDRCALHKYRPYQEGPESAPGERPGVPGSTIEAGSV